MNRKTVIVAGITRSGLTVTMQMLDKGGYPCVGDYPAYEPFPLGEIDWGLCDGMAVKVVDTHLELPPPGDYLVIRLSRDLKQQALSQKKFIAAVFGRLPNIKTKQLVNSNVADYKIIDEWASKYKVLRLNFEDIIEHPKMVAEKLAVFTGFDLDVDSMSACVKARGSDCYEGLLELDMLP